jgi:hypothetical protein
MNPSGSRSSFPFRLALVALTMALSIASATAQDSLRPRITRAVEEARQTAKRDLAARFDRLAQHENRFTAGFQRWCDSLLRARADSLAPEDADSLRASIAEARKEIREVFRDQQAELAQYGLDFDTLLLDLAADDYDAYDDFAELLDTTRVEIARLWAGVDEGFEEILSGWSGATTDILRLDAAAAAEALRADAGDGEAVDTPSIFTAGLSLSTGFNYRGRTADSAGSGSSTLSLMYMHSSGFFASVNVFYLRNATPHLNEADVSLGYDWSISDRFSLSLAYTRMFYDAQSAIFSRAITLKLPEGNVDVVATLNDNPRNRMELDLAYQIPSVLDLSYSAEYLFGGGWDADMSLGCSRNFTFEEALFSHDLSFTPGLSSWFGLLFSYKKGAVKKSGSLIDIAIDKKGTGIAIYSYQLSLPLTWKLGAVDLSFSTLLTLSTNANAKFTGSTKKSEVASSFSLGVSYTW